MDEPDLDQVAAALRQVSASGGFNALLGCTLVAVRRGEVDIALDLRPELTQHHGFAHGGVIGALADIACAWAAATVLGDVVTSGYSLQLLAPARGRHLRATGMVLRAGRRQATVEARIYAQAADADPVFVAVALGSVSAVGDR